MKKFFFAFCFLFLSVFLIESAWAFDTVDLQVINVSQENQDALTTGAYPGDVLKFDLNVTPVDGEESFAVVDVSDVIQKSQIIDKGFGELSGDELAFPVFEGSEMSFFVRVNENCSPQDSTMEAFAHGDSLRVDLYCDAVPEPIPTPDPVLPKTGTPAIGIILTITGLVVFGIFFLLFTRSTRKD